MRIETWFPLAVAQSDLAPSPSVRAAMLAALAPFIAAAAAQRRPKVAWTGDVNGCADLHRRPAFAWLRGEVEREALAYADALGCDLSRLQLYFQGSWPVLSRGAESVASHIHELASLSAVYYLQVPSGSHGVLVFENWGNQNALAPDFGHPGTAFTREATPFNVREVCYAPQEDRLLLFPARQPHAVRPHGADAIRIALTFDIVAVDRANRAERAYADATWDAFRRPA